MSPPPSPPPPSPSFPLVSNVVEGAPGPIVPVFLTAGSVVGGVGGGGGGGGSWIVVWFCTLGGVWEVDGVGLVP